MNGESRPNIGQSPPSGSTTPPNPPYLREYRPPTDPSPEEARKLEETILTGSNTVPDPRPKSRIEAEKSDIPIVPEPRLACAGHYANFLTRREAEIEAWGHANRTRSPQYKQPIDHTKDELEYDKAILAAIDADPQKDCSPCLGLNCALKHGIPPKQAFDPMHKKTELLNGQTIRPSDAQVYILKGGARSSIAPETLAAIEKKQAKRVDKHAGTYWPKELTLPSRKLPLENT